MAAAGTRTAPRHPIADGEGSEVTRAVAALSLERLSGTPVDVKRRDGTVETVYIGKLSIDQSVALAAVIREAIRTLDKTIMTSVAEEEGRGLYAQALDMFLPLLTSDQLVSLFSVVTDRPSAWVRAEIGAEDMANILEAVAEHNDFAAIVRPFRRLGLRAVAAVTQAAQPSSPEPSTAPTSSPSSQPPATANETSEATPQTG